MTKIEEIQSTIGHQKKMVKRTKKMIAKVEEKMGKIIAKLDRESEKHAKFITDSEAHIANLERMLADEQAVQGQN